LKFKIKTNEKRQIFLISNDDCITILKNKRNNKTINDLFINPKCISESGKILLDNSNVLTIQKGRPYFFPYCKNDIFINQTSLNSTPLTSNTLSLKKQIISKYIINLTYYDITKQIFSISTNTLNFQCNCPKIIFKKQKNYIFLLFLK